MYVNKSTKILMVVIARWWGCTDFKFAFLNVIYKHTYVCSQEIEMFIFLKDLEFITLF